MSDTVLFVVFPYAALLIAVWGGIHRYRHDRFSYSSLSSELLENRLLFWGSVTWHYGIVLILLVHLVALLVPGLWARLLAARTVLYALELTGFALALATVVGLGMLFLRRLTIARIRAVTSAMDWVLLAVLLVQVAIGFWVSVVYRWGGDWYVHTAVPWLHSLARLDPQTQFVSSLPWIVKLHMLTGFVVIALFPLSRLVHLVAFPFWYLWRPYQVVLWNRRSTRA